MGEHSHISMDFDAIISVTLENYVDIYPKPGSLKEDKQYYKSQGHDTNKSPSYWSRVCLLNIAKLATVGSTMRRVIETLFQCSDAENHWSTEKRLACNVLMYLQSLLQESGDNSHLLLHILVKHLDHKNVVKQPRLQTDIVNVTTQIAQGAKQQASVAITGAISDLIKHLRKCLQFKLRYRALGL
ncbi:hypothetical protein D8674_010580 [Pyrus ussuriensis x Pyrus communis]|uniref:Uncharacterized protein n=1 Tax=Pyrus ussuriensis x Pyrus communis TaxID=2448454 RepID=A0A5N5FB46_9ROSA|nr:hypothetical protein D8674_010580 [Pyrus ussuriensis x Pyrus communis]